MQECSRPSVRICGFPALKGDLSAYPDQTGRPRHRAPCGDGIRHAGIGYSLPHRQSDLVVIDNPESLHRMDQKRHGSLQESGRLLKSPDKGLMVMATRRLGPEDMSNFLYQNGWAIFSMSAIAMKEKRWLFPPFDDHTQERGDPLQWRLGWDELEARLYDLGGESFAYQYLQGDYIPNNRNFGNVATDENERMFFFAGKPSLTSVAAKHLKELRAEYEKRMEQIENLMGSMPLPPDGLPPKTSI